ncbi:MAG: LuxR C-terminal-related transcriptional regulator [Solirubrobacterales bacterium]
MPPLLATKTVIPPLHQHVFVRERLITILESSASSVILAIAPAGFGKTTCLAVWSKRRVEQGEAVAWCSLSEEDNDPVRFLSYVLESLDSVVDDRISLTPIQELIQAAPNTQPERIVALLIDALSASERPVNLILDDYHVITSPMIHKIMHLLAWYHTAQFRIAIGSRWKPPFRIAKLKASGQLIELEAEDFRFSLEETRLFFRFAGIQVTEPDVQRINQIAEGWAAALQLIALKISSWHRRFDQYAPAEDIIPSLRAAEIFDFLAEEVFEDLSPTAQRFLLCTSVVDRFCAGLCAALTGDASQATLDQLTDSGLFILPLNEEQTWFRYHNLLGQFLRDRLNDERPELVQELYLKACRWFQENDLMTEALAYALKARNYELASTFIARVAEALLPLHQFDTLENLLNQFPQAFADQDTYILALKAYLMFGRARLDQVFTSLSKLKSVLDQQEHQWKQTGNPALQASVERGRGLCAAIEASTLANLQRTEEAIPAANQALVALHDEDTFFRSLAMLSLGISLAYTGQPHSGLEIISRAAALCNAAERYPLAIVGFGHVGLIQFYLGDLQGAIRSMEDSLRRTKERNAHLMPENVLLQLYLAEMYYECNHIEKTRSLLDSALSLAQQVGSDIGVMNVLLSQLVFEQHIGNQNNAIQCARKARSLAIANGLNLLIGTLGVIEMSLGLAPEEGVLDEKLLFYVKPIFIRVKVGSLMRQGRMDEALEVALAEKNRLFSLGLTGAYFWFQVAEAVIRYHHWNQNRLQPDYQAALELMAEALNFGSQHGWISIFLEYGPSGMELIRAVRNNLVNPDYADFLLHLAKSENRAMPQNALSKRELEILQYVAAGASNLEIAEALVVSLATVKTHLNHIFNKLEANNRTEAIAKARQLGMLSWDVEPEGL